MKHTLTSLIFTIISFVALGQITLYDFQSAEIKKVWKNDSSNWLLPPKFSLLDQKTLLGTAVDLNGEYMIKQVQSNTFLEVYKDGTKKRKLFGLSPDKADSIYIFHPKTQLVFCKIYLKKNIVSTLYYPSLKLKYHSSEKLIYLGFDEKKKMEFTPIQKNEDKVTIFGKKERKIAEGQYYFGKPHGTWTEFLGNGSFLKYQWAMGFMLTTVSN